MSSSKSNPCKPAVSNAKTGRRKRTDDEKREFVREGLQDGMVQAQLARWHGISPSQLWDWRARDKSGLLCSGAGFSQVFVVEDDPETAPEQAAPATVQPNLIVEVARHYRLTIPAGFNVDAATQLLRGLA